MSCKAAYLILSMWSARFAAAAELVFNIKSWRELGFFCGLNSDDGASSVKHIKENIDQIMLTK